MAIDFDKEESRQAYLNTKLDDLLEGINESYGKALLDELLQRLEHTIADFNEEVASLLEQLKSNAELKDKLLEEIKSEEERGEEVKTEGEKESLPEENEMSEWEKRVEKLGK